MSKDDFIALLNRVLRLDARGVEGGGIAFKVSSGYMQTEVDWVIPENIVEEILGYDSAINESPIHILTHKSCEFLLRDASKYSSRIFGQVEYEDKDNQINYKLGFPSLRMAVELLKFSDNGHPEYAQEARLRLKRFPRDIEGDGALFLTHVVPSRYYSLQIKLGEENINQKFDYYLTLCNSFCFMCGYNWGRSFLPISKLGDIVDSSFSRRLQRCSIEEMEPPRRKYIGELVHFYARGISGESRDYQYLSYYHVLEYFFEKVYSDNVVDKMRKELTRPGFSYKRDKDLLSFEKTMRSTFKAFSTASGVNEQDALILALKKYIPDLETLKNNLETVENGLIDYLKATESPFSSHKINFEIDDVDAIYINLANRIYNTRNAIAHSKETLTKKKFVPFKHDVALAKEVLLIRVVAEEVIINSSKEL